jgi:lipopolysaccharide assembly protein A
MRFIGWILKVSLFVLVLAFALKNTEPVTIRYYFGGEWKAPLVFVLLLVFCAGVGVGLLAAMGQMIRQRRELGAARRALRDATRDREAAEARRDVAVRDVSG